MMLRIVVVAALLEDDVENAVEMAVWLRASLARSDVVSTIEVSMMERFRSRLGALG